MLPRPPYFSCLPSRRLPAAFSQKSSADAVFNPHFEVFALPGSGLSNNVQGSVQDSAGFLWFASREGLIRYDGQTFTTWFHKPDDPNSLLNDNIEHIFLDSEGTLWLTHWVGGGLTAFDPAAEKFTRYSFDPNNPDGLGGNTTSVVIEDREGYIWVGGQWGLDRFNRKTGKFKHFQHDPKNPRSLSYKQVRALYVDKKGTLWVGTGYTWDDADPKRQFGGLNRYDPATESFTRYLHDPKDSHSLSHNHVRALLEDSRGNFWVGTGCDGLHLMNRETGTFTRLSHEAANPGKLSRPLLDGKTAADQALEAHVTSIIEDEEGRIWVSAVSGGLNIFEPDGSSNPASGRVRHYESKAGEGNLGSNFLWHLFRSADGTVWVASGGGGVFKVKNEGLRIPHFVPDSTTFQVNEASNAVKDRAVYVWVGYYDVPGFPLIRYDRKTGKSLRIPGGNAAPGGLNARAIYWLLPDAEGGLWVGTENGLWRRDPGTGAFRQFPNALSKSTWTSFIVQDRKGYVWTFGRLHGLNRLDPKTGQWIVFQHDPADPNNIGGNAVRGLYQDADENYWTSGGTGHDSDNPRFLDRFHPDSTDAGGRVVFTHFKGKKSGQHRVPLRRRGRQILVPRPKGRHPQLRPGKRRRKNLHARQQRRTGQVHQHHVEGEKRQVVAQHCRRRFRLRA